MRGCLAGADNAPGLIPRFRIRFRPSVDNEQEHGSNRAHGLPTISIGMRVWAADGKLIVKNELGSLEAQAVIPLVGSVFLILPRPPHAIPIT